MNLLATSIRKPVKLGVSFTLLDLDVEDQELSCRKLQTPGRSCGRLSISSFGLHILISALIHSHFTSAKIHLSFFRPHRTAKFDCSLRFWRFKWIVAFSCHVKELPCSSHCDSIYIGQTKRALWSRIKERRTNLKTLQWETFHYYQAYNL